MERAVRSGLLCWVTLLLVGWGTSAQGQTFQGSLTGTVTDPTGAAIPGVTVSAAEQERGFRRSGVTLDDGTYQIALLPPGRYVLTAEKEGFEKTSKGPIALTVNQHQLVDFRLNVGSLATVVTVEAPAVVVDTETSSVGTTIDQVKVEEVPLNGRQFLELMLFTPGIVPGTPGSRISDRGGAINVNGLQDSMNSYWLDGLDDTSTGVGQFTVAPPLDSIQEMRLETGVYDAKFGTHAGAQVNVVTKSGTNDLHGTLYEFFRNSALDARNFFEPEVPPFRRNQFGGTVGGPVVLPGVYDGHDRTFFFFTYEGLRERRSFFNRARVPTLAERGGDFSDLQGPDCSVQTVLLNPLTGQPFTKISEVLPSGPDPVGQGLMNVYPLPNVTNAPCGGVNYTAQVQRQIDLDTFMARLDHHWGTKDNLFIRYNLNSNRGLQPSGPNFGSGTSVPGFGGFNHNQYQMAGMDWTHLFSPTFINELKLGYNRWQERLNNEDQGNLIAQTLGILGLQRTDPSQTGVPNVNVAGYDGLGADTTTPQSGAVNTFQLADTLTQVHGSHSLAYGFDFRKVYRGNFSIDSLIRGEFDFTGLATGGLGAVPSGVCVPPACTLGNSVADALLGLPTFWINGFQQYISGTLGEYDFFAQDTWKVRRNLTLNLGLRYEYKGLTTDKFDHLANFNFDRGFLMVAGRQFVTLENYDPTTGSFVPVGQESLGGTAENRALQLPDKNNFAPRIGFAWQPFGDSKTAVRGGYGVYYNQTFGDVYFQKSANPPFVRINAGNLGGALPAIIGGQVTIGSGELIQNSLVGLAGPVYPTTSPFQVAFDDATVQGWTFDVQREVKTNWLFDVGYVGTRGLHLPRETDPNQPDNSNPTLCDPVSGCPRRFRNYSGFSYTEASGSSIYHALQFKVERHYTGGLSILGAYTWSKSIDSASGAFGTNRNANFPQNSRNLAAEKGLSDFDYRHRLSLAYLYDIPVGTRVWKAQNTSVNYLIKDWQLSGIVTAQTGPHFTPQISGDISGADEQNITGSPTDRPNVTGGAFYPSHRTPERWVLTSAFAPQASLTFGNAGRNILTGPATAAWDFGLMRRFRLRETTNLEFRAEMFNIFNRSNFDIPQHDWASSSFGQIFNTVQPVAGLASGGPGDPREVQLGLKLVW